jgi:hypothetical protein
MSSMEGGAAAPPSQKSMGVSGALSVLAILLAVVALAVNFVIPGPAGPAGLAGADGDDGVAGQDGTDGTDGVACWDLNGNGAPDLGTEDRNLDATVDVRDCTGPQGPPGPGTLMSFGSLGGGAPAPAACTDILMVVLTPATQGTIVVTLTLVLVVEHTTAFDDLIDFYGGGCPGSIVSQELIPATLPTATFETTVAVQWTVTVGSPGPYSIPASVQWSAGMSGGDSLAWPVMVAVFYPA